jgi:2-polyprenyl-3-methyl-5-hydroxy-6-metoxy-1,4-benzoquinol methylase
VSSAARRRALDLLVRRLVEPEAARRNGPRVNERPIEYRFVFDVATRVAPDTVLDVGTGKASLPHLLWICGYRVTAIDNVTDYWPDGMVNRHFHVLDEDITRPRLERRFDLVTCISTIEHIADHETAFRRMVELAEPGGHVALTFPYNEREYHPNAYDLPGSSYGQSNPYATQIYSRAELDRWLAVSGAELVDQEYWRVFSGDNWTVGEHVYPYERVGREDRHQLSCLLVRRPG